MLLSNLVSALKSELSFFWSRKTLSGGGGGGEEATRWRERDGGNPMTICCCSILSLVQILLYFVLGYGNVCQRV